MSAAHWQSMQDGESSERSTLVNTDLTYESSKKGLIPHG